MNNTLFYISSLLFIYFIFVWIGYSISLLATIHLILKKFNETKYNNIIESINISQALPITTITPAFNEMSRISNTVKSILNSDYKNINMIIVNDGSTDQTLQYLIDTYALQQISPSFRQRIVTGKVRAYYQSTTIPNFIVIDKEHSPFANSGADCINAGLNACRTPLFVTLDADTVIEPESLSRMLFLYLTHPHCVAIGGNIYIPDKTKIKDGKLTETSIPSNITLGVQITEYLRSFIYGHEGWTPLGGALCHAGAFTLLEHKAVMDIGGYDAYNFSYDAEIIMKLHHYMLKNHYPYSILYASNAIAWAESPMTFKQLWKQRNYWQRGLLRSVILHKQMLLNPRYKRVGLVGFPVFIFYEVVGPIVEGVSYVVAIIALIFHQISFVEFTWLLALAFGFLLVITAACMLISLVTYNKYYRKNDILKFIYLTFIDLILYRPLRSLSCLRASFQYVINRLRGKAL